MSNLINLNKPIPEFVRVRISSLLLSNIKHRKARKERKGFLKYLSKIQCSGITEKKDSNILKKITADSESRLGKAQTRMPSGHTWIPAPEG
ncbi:hypothetical protein [Candidatus Methanoperedens sp. BLZ2]|uniref:hypothetical protein n=1 Tax=Candidatus Methanoperedens sp. BLZ2 TaxID=2035255 RepID=UPI000BE2FC5B|nr:hypothetical protein [Candidatus Methanoperedens sp. BLZ2]KAB2945891.1 MAG: hypothetical protein F9K14_09250 [Candidatus Methanoperedens sp.]MBZ0174343.1 hypothetical protein [Candidatus Methanoperedens nitroreducens]